ncbi:MAG: right-handed parallel beta-helix repeat-containing protein [Thermodesulfobacteriota bacterium]
MRFADLIWTPIFWLISALAWISHPIRRLKLRRTILFLALALVLATGPAQATIWHCIPYVAPGGGSGAEIDPWKGFASIVWGAGGVVAGDTLYVRGLHYDSSHSDHKLAVGASGSDGAPITIRGDWPGSPGHILITLGTWTAASWVAEGTYAHHYKQTFSGGTNYYGVIEAINGTIFTCLRKYTGAPDGSWTPGSFSIVAGSPNTIYYYPGDAPNEGTITDGSHQIYKDTAATYGNIGGSTARSYITVKNISLYSNNRAATDGGGIFLPTTSANWIIDNVTFKGIKYCISARTNTSNITVQNCTFYRIGQSITSAGGTATNWLVQDNTITENDYYYQFQTTDAEGISFQAASGCQVLHNTISQCLGGAIIFYQGSDAIMQNNIIKYNYVDTVADIVAAGKVPAGFHASGTNDQNDKTKAGGNIVAYNIFAKVTGGANSAAIRIKAYKPTTGISWSFYNNTIYNADNAVYCTDYFPTSGVVGWYFENNILAGCTKNLAWESSGTKAGAGVAGVTIDYNLWSPDANWEWADTDGSPVVYSSFNDWKSGVSQDSHSLTPADPVFLNATGSYSAATDFQIKSASPAKNHGDNSVWSGQASITDYAGAAITDAEGNVTAKGGTVDIGAYELTKAAAKIILVQ